MQVTQVSDHVSHAVIGKAQAREFGISDSAEFFNILSNTLYSDKILAVVREVLCNAWDIHIQTGRTDVPVEVTLRDGELVIRDHGTGIHDDDIHTTYAVVGNSTKKLDVTQTGGFGLGSKAPFAYVDHFEVTSRHAGRRTIYAVSKSSAEVAGKPSITPLVCVPCPEDDSGLTVKLSVKREDMTRFKQVIEMIVRFGEMNVLFNETVTFPKLPFSEAEHGFLMTTDVQDVPGGENNLVFVRYGNVVYPVPAHEKISHLHDRAQALIRCIGNVNGYYSKQSQAWKLVLQAAPNSISVTPSRESLSMTDHTVETLRGLLERLLRMTDAQLDDACVEVERECVDKVAREGCPGSLLTDVDKVPTLFDNKYRHDLRMVASPSIIKDVPGMARSQLSLRYPDSASFRYRDVLLRLDALEATGFGGPRNRGKIQSFRREFLSQKKGLVDPKAASLWFQRTIAQPLARKLNEVPELQGSKLMVFSDLQETGEYGSRRRSRFHEAKDFAARRIEDYMPFLRNIVVLSFNRIDLEERLPRFPEFDERLGSTKDFFCYVVSRNEAKAQVARDFFLSQGMTLLDLTMPQNWEPKTVTTPAPKAKTTKLRKKGLPLLSNILTTDLRGQTKLDYNRYQPSSEVYEDMTRTEEPEFIVQFNPRSQSADMFHGLCNDTKVTIVRLFGDLGGVTVNGNQTSRFTGKGGVPTLQDWLFARLLSEVTTNQRLVPSLGYSHEKIRDNRTRELISASQQKRRIMELVLHNPDLAIEFGVLNETTEEDEMLRSLVGAFNGRNWQWHYSAFAEVKKVVDAVPMSLEAEELARLVARSNLTDLVSVYRFYEIFRRDRSSRTTTPELVAERASALDILQYVLA